MKVSFVEINCANIVDWDSFHDEFVRAFGFPDSYGRNMDAWIDCMSSLSSPEDGMSRIHCEEGEVIAVELTNTKGFRERCPDHFSAINECMAFVTWRLIKNNHRPVLALAYHV